MGAWIHRPVRFVIGLVLGAAMLRYLLVPGVWFLFHAGDVDRELAAREQRLQPIAGEVATVRWTEGANRRKSFRYVTTYVTYQATPPGRTTASQTSESLGTIPISRPGEVPATLPQRGQPRALWYDPEDPSYLTFSAPGSGGALSSYWLGGIIAGLGALGTLVAALLIKTAVRRPAVQSAT